MDPVASRGSQSLSTTVEPEPSPSGAVPKEGGAKSLPAASSPASTNKLQSYLATGGAGQESMCRVAPPPFSRSEPQAEELKLLEQFRTQQAKAALGRGVELCKADVDAPVFGQLGVKHHWLRTSTREAGMGVNDGSIPGVQPASTPIYGPTQLKDHTGRGEKPGSECTRVENVDEACINRELAQLGKPLGDWTATNNCQTYAWDVRAQCSTKERGPHMPDPRVLDPGKI